MMNSLARHVGVTERGEKKPAVFGVVQWHNIRS
jgi:hypothetical protein